MLVLNRNCEQVMFAGGHQATIQERVRLQRQAVKPILEDWAEGLESIKASLHPVVQQSCAPL